MDMDEDDDAIILRTGTGTGSTSDQANLLPSSSSSSHPPSSLLDSLSSTQLQHLQTELSTELYGFHPASFTSRIVDSANQIIYDVIDKVHVEVKKRWSNNNNDADADEVKKDQVEKGVNRLETLLMAAVDLRFDQAEVYLLRNIFRPPSDLIPWILLPHHPQEGFTPYASIDGQNEREDDLLMKELEEEIREANLKREEVMLIGTVQERLDRRLEALKKVKSGLSELLAQGGARDTLSDKSNNIALSLPLYISQCKALLSAPTTSQSAALQSEGEGDGEEAWKRSREAYLSWRSERAYNSGNGKEGADDEGMRAMNKGLMETGGQKDLKALRDLLAA